MKFISDFCNQSGGAVRCAGFALALACAIVAFGASERWSKKDSSHWDAGDIQQILTNSPWAKPASGVIATPEPEYDRSKFPDGTPPYGMTGNGGVSDGHWDGGVGRMKKGEPGTVPVIVRWNSALPVRLALERSPEAHASGPDSKEHANDYAISVIGLLPAAPAHSDAESAEASDESESQSLRPPDPQQLRTGMLNASRLVVRGKSPLAPEDAKIDPSTGELQLFFSKSKPITLDGKEVTFITQFGSLCVRQRFRLKDMMYGGKLEL